MAIIIKANERLIQRAYIQWVRIKQHQDWRYKQIFHVPNGFYGGAGRQGIINKMQMKSDGLASGVPDIVVLVPSKHGHALLLEFKSDTGTQSDEQKEWEKRSTKLGYKYLLIRSAQIAMDATETWIDNALVRI